MAFVRRPYLAAIVVCILCSGVSCESENSTRDASVSEGRTFGHHFLKRISFAIIPAAFVVGVITTLLGALTVVSIKGLGVGVILLILAIGQILSRTFGHAHAATYAAPLPVVYSHHSPASSPVWVDKDW